MPFQIVRQDSASRFQDAQGFLSAIKAAELQGNGQHSAELNARKGLFLVLLYSAFESSHTRSFAQICTLINAKNIKYNHAHSLLYPLALDPQFRSLAQSARAHKWEKRMQIFRQQICNEMVILQEGAFSDEMQNVWAKTIELIFDVLGITEPALYDVKVRQYINEVVEKRNAVAHGREGAASVGQAYTVNELQKRHDELSTQVQYMFAKLEAHIAAKSFVKNAYRRYY